MLQILNFHPCICYGTSKEPSQWDGSFKHPKPTEYTDYLENPDNLSQIIWLSNNFNTHT